MADIYTSAEQPYPHYGMQSYRIEVDADPHRPLQRHIWTRADGAVEAQDWIPTCPSIAAKAIREYQPIHSAADRVDAAHTAHEMHRGDR